MVVGIGGSPPKYHFVRCLGPKAVFEKSCKQTRRDSTVSGSCHNGRPAKTPAACLFRDGGSSGLGFGDPSDHASGRLEQGRLLSGYADSPSDRIKCASSHPGVWGRIHVRSGGARFAARNGHGSGFRGLGRRTEVPDRKLDRKAEFTGDCRSLGVSCSGNCETCPACWAKGRSSRQAH